MKSVSLGLICCGVLLATVAISRPSGQAPAAGVPTFSRDVAPILDRQCVGCHRPGTAAPMSLLTYADARPWARAIGKAVADGVMPPWHADAPPGTFENERRLTAAEKDVIARWVSDGAPEGDRSQLPPRPEFPGGWRIGKPDAVYEMQEEYAVPARGTVEYEFFYIPLNLTETKWLQAIEVKPGSRAHVHHVLVYLNIPPDGTRPQPGLRPVLAHSRIPPRRRERGVSTHPRRTGPLGSRLVATYAPGTDPMVFRPGTAMRIPAGAVLELQMHYTTNGTPAIDRTQVGLVFATSPPADEIRAGAFIHGQFTIPAGASDHRVDTQVEFVEDATVWGIFPHTHLRGKRWSYELELPDGSRRPLLSVPRYDFNWQTYYMFKEPLRLPRGSRVISSAWYDNSAANRFNPDPTIAVGWGEQTWEEMQYTGLLYTLE